jgi:glycosyltransferase involved in cell wall biosynthesis
MRRAKVLIIVENLPVPFDTRVWKEARSLRDAGFEVTVICPKGRGFTRTHEVLDGVRIYRHPMPVEGDGALSYLLEYGNALVWEIALSWWVYLRYGFQVIQGCNPPDSIVLVASMFKPFGIKYIFDHHDANPELYSSKYRKGGLLYRLLLLLEKWTFRGADVVMSTNESYRSLAIRRGGMDPEDVFVVRNGPDLQTFRPVEPRPELKHGKEFLVGYVGTMSVQEGLDILLRVADHIRRSGRTDVHFTCVGGGPGLDELRRMNTEMDLDDMVTFTGRVPDDELVQILSTADVCVNPDRPCEMNDISTMIKIMEYMALGKPIVQFDLKEGRYSAGEASLYADNRNQVSDFASKILQLLDQPELRRSMGNIGQKRVRERFAWQYSEQHLVNAYDRALAKA